MPSKLLINSTSSELSYNNVGILISTPLEVLNACFSNFFWNLRDKVKLSSFRILSSVSFHMGIFNIIVVIVLYVLTYKILDERNIEREKNKNEISVLLIKECYHECLEYVELIKQDIVEKYIVPKIDFNSTNYEKTIISNLQNSPFLNESIIMDLVKDGQINKRQIEGYFEIRKKYQQYILMRIIFFDAPHKYEQIKTDLCNTINNGIKKIDNQT